MNVRHPLGTIAQLWRYPVKSLAPEELERARLGPDGLDGDRARALFVATPGHARSGKTYRGKEHRLLHTARGLSRALDLAAERELEIDVRGDGPHFDAGSVSIVISTWLAEVEALLGAPVDPQRFRPNLFVEAEPWFAGSEDALVGAVLAAGDARLEVVAPIQRCVTITYDVATGAPDPHLGRTVAEHRANVMGVYCDVRRAGTIVRGQRLTIERSAPTAS